LLRAEQPFGHPVAFVNHGQICYDLQAESEGLRDENQRLTEELAATRETLRRDNRSEPLPYGISLPRTFVRAKAVIG
jgi:hypothetical protein